VPPTALQHFGEDISRAKCILNHADMLPTTSDAERLLRSDLFRSAWMFAIGALDAYFCDAFTDIVAATVSSKSRQPGITLPEFFYEIKFPIRAILEEYENPNWRWRMAARKMMERENVLSLTTVQNLFNRFFPEDRRSFKASILDAWICHADAKVRLFGITRSAYQALNNDGKEQARKQAREQMEGRFRDLFQRRHDCIHNCDRPRMRPQPLTTSGTVLKVIQDLEFMVNRCNEHINAQFTLFLTGIGCSTTTITAAGY
jgi:hypothetical protein